MTPDQFIDRALAVPFRFGDGDWFGADCWGLVELWYAALKDIMLTDRVGGVAGHGALQNGVEDTIRWARVETPADHDLVLMRAGDLEAGHVGIHWQGHVLHTSERTGCVYQPMTDRTVRSRITGFLTYR